MSLIGQFWTTIWIQAQSLLSNQIWVIYNLSLKYLEILIISNSFLFSRVENDYLYIGENYFNEYSL